MEGTAFPYLKLLTIDDYSVIKKMKNDTTMQLQSVQIIYWFYYSI